MTTRTAILVGMVTIAVGCSKADKPTAVVSAVEAPAAAPAAPTPPPAPPAEAVVPPSSYAKAVFAEAVTENSPEEQSIPPERTLAGRATAKLREEVQRQFAKVDFTTPAGKRLAYTATLDTEYGTVVMTMLPEIAPNHVRNFVALARAGYYDGLLFENIVRQEGEDGTKLEMVQGGCPLGTGEAGIGHLGYWLKPEFSDKVAHEAGTVGAWHDSAADSAACRFYITLGKAPVMDGNYTAFAQVTQGLDVVRTIGQLPRPDGSARPMKPAAIRTVTIQTREVD